MRSSFIPTVVASGFLAIAPCASAQYSSDPATPNALVTTALDDVQTKLAPAPNGDQFLSYFSDSGYDVFVSRVSSTGSVLWSTKVEDRTFSSTTDYGFASDSSGNAYVCYTALDPVSGFAQFKVSSVNASGAIRWSTAMYTYTNNSFASLGNGRCVVASDGFVWGAGSVGFDSALARLNAETGAVTSSLFITEVGAKQICSGMQPSTSGAVLLSTVRYTTNFSNKILRVRKINADGTYAWGTSAGVAVATVGNIQTGNFPDFISDGAGGGYLPWYTTSPLNCRVQHVDTDGNMTFGADGVPVALSTTADFGGTVATVNRANPTIVLGSDNRVYAYFKAYSSSIGGAVWYGIGAQCFDSTGVAQWDANTGVMIEDYSPSAANSVYDRIPGAAMKLGTGVGVSYISYASAYAGNGIASRTNTDGTTAWKVSFASEATQKYRFSSSPCPTGSILAWQANAGGPSDIFGARINSDGTVGNPAPSCIADLNNDGVVNGADLGILLAAWGPCSATPCTGDLNNDGVVDGADLGILLSAWGNCPA